ncbi:hypothetical protein HPB47_024198 [Ixodes persulcatus]|uniref:Uncharacterized protein n=1 Tax=Ixodes persulcatus TaxID=34615 RepID=A0AC60Q506_IXOPE|nr:hypothetical protein HPB47_024198 [Ixodes persulcatus]
MKVGVAVKLFWESPPAIRYAIDRGMLPREAESTAWFMELVSKWYKLMSARQPMFALSHMDESRYQNAIETLSLAFETVQTMKMGMTAHRKPSQAGLLIATHVVLKLQKSLLDDRGTAWRTCFSIIRLRKPVSSAYNTKCALKLVCGSQFLHTQSSSSYELDGSVYLADLLAHGTKHTVHDPDPLQNVENLFVESLSIEEEDILCYAGRFILKGVMEGIDDCHTCKTLETLGSGLVAGCLQAASQRVAGRVFETPDINPCAI